MTARAVRTTFVPVCALLLSAGVTARAGHPPRSRPAFNEVADVVGLVFQHSSAPSGEFSPVEIMGSGAALVDFDRDGDLDVYLVQGSPDAGPSRLFRNQLVEDGTLRFVDITEHAGVGQRAWGMGVAVGDYDDDGHLDLYVTNFGPNVLYRNNGDGTFRDVTKHARVQDDRWNASAAFVDYDEDGDLDLFVTAYLDFSPKNNKRCYDSTGARDYCLPAEYRPVPDRLFRNDGDGRFTDVTATSGLTAETGPGLGVACADFDGDGLIDIYVANDGSANHLWLNQGRGTFEEAGLISGTAFDVAGTAEAGMGVAVGDVDIDGDEDIFVTNLVGETNTLYRNDAQAVFEDVTNGFRLGSMSLPFTGFGTDWFDYDNDGDLDVFVANGAVSIVDALRGSPFPYQQQNLLFRQDEGSFRDVTKETGVALEPSEVSRGAAFGDIDNDGDIDIVVTNNNGKTRLLLNTDAGSQHWLAVTLEGVKANSDGLGASVRVIRPDAPALVRRVRTDGSYLSASDARVHVGLGADPTVTAVIVEWPDGATERWTPDGIDRVITLREGTGTRPKTARARP